MIRPFTIQSNQLKKRGTVFKIKNHRGKKITTEAIKLPKQFFDKLLSYPITAFGYDIHLQNKTRELPNPKFDRHDVIKALDFWIQHWVYQNKCDYILSGTVNKDFELTLKELIETRDAVLTCPVDTKFTRGRIRFKEDVILPSKIVLTEAVIGDGYASTVTDPFCHKVLEMTREEYQNYNGRHVPTVSKTSQMISESIRAQMNWNQQENFTDDGPRFEFTISRNIGRDINGDFIHVGEPTMTANLNGLDIEVSDVRLGTEDNIFDAINLSGLHPGIRGGGGSIIRPDDIEDLEEN